MERETEKEYKYGWTALAMKENGETIVQMAMENYTMLMAIFMKAAGRTIELMALVSFFSIFLGMYTHANGATYEGQWKEDKQHGKGVETWPDGARYDGMYFDGKKHGRGRLEFVDR